MKKIITLMITLAMVLTMAVPAYADATDTADPAAPAELTVAQVKALTTKNVKAASYSYTKIKVT